MCTNGGLLYIGTLGTCLNEILIDIQNIYIHENAFEKIVCNITTILSPPLCVKLVYGATYQLQHSIYLNDNKIDGYRDQSCITRLLYVTLICSHSKRPSFYGLTINNHYRNNMDIRCREAYRLLLVSHRYTRFVGAYIITRIIASIYSYCGKR